MRFRIISIFLLITWLAAHLALLRLMDRIYLFVACAIGLLPLGFVLGDAFRKSIPPD